MFAIGKDPIAGGKKSYPGNPCVIRGADGVLRNRGEYDAAGNMVKALPMTYDEFLSGAERPLAAAAGLSRPAHPPRRILLGAPYMFRAGFHNLAGQPKCCNTRLRSSRWTWS